MYPPSSRGPFSLPVTLRTRSFPRYHHLPRAPTTDPLYDPLFSSLRSSRSGRSGESRSTVFRVSNTLKLPGTSPSYFCIEGKRLKCFCTGRELLCNDPGKVSKVPEVHSPAPRIRSHPGVTRQRLTTSFSDRKQIYYFPLITP